MIKNSVLLTLSLAGCFAIQAQANQLVITDNLSNVRVTGSVNDYITGKQAGYTDGNVFSSATIPLHIINASYEKEAAITSATAGSQAALTLDIAETGNNYRIWGDISSKANTKMNSLDDNDATALGEAVVDLAFTLSSDYYFNFTSNLFDATGTGESEVELINRASGSVFSQLFSEDSSNLNFSGNLLAGDYALFIGALSETFDGDSASASVGYDFQLTAVPIPAALPLFLSGLMALGFKSRSRGKAFSS